MPKRVKNAKPKATKKPSSDPMVRARQLMQEHQAKADAGASHWKPEATPAVPTPEQVSALMSALGRKGGKASGAKRMENLSDRQRKEIAKKAAAARWAKSKR
jgi:hypothetical protein